MPIISAVGLFSYDKFEETPNEKVVNISKLTKSYFSSNQRNSREHHFIWRDNIKTRAMIFYML